MIHHYQQRGSLFMQKTEVTENADGTRRSLSNRNVQMIAIGGTIGTGLFLGSGTTISKTGPSILLVYLVLGIFFFLMMRAIGEMLYSDPSQHTFVSFITRYLGPTVGDLLAWTFILCHGRNYRHLYICSVLVPKYPVVADSNCVLRNAGSC